MSAPFRSSSRGAPFGTLFRWSHVSDSSHSRLGGPPCDGMAFTMPSHVGRA